MRDLPKATELLQPHQRPHLCLERFAEALRSWSCVISDWSSVFSAVNDRVSLRSGLRGLYRGDSSGAGLVCPEGCFSKDVTSVAAEALGAG